MKYNFFFKIFLFLLIVSNFSYSQIPTTPTVASLFKVNPTSVNESTGTANISIPLYSFNVDKLNLPINLSYNSNGIKVEEGSGNAGTGWSLLMGGVITRQINGQPDEFVKQVIKELEPGFTSDPVTNEDVACQRFTIKSALGWLENSSKNLIAAQYFLQNNGDMTNFKGEVINNVFSGDKQPDIFSYILPTGKRGSFMLVNFNDSSIISSTNDKIEVTYETGNDSVNRSILRFNITDEYGNSYLFDVIEQRNDSFYGSGFGIIGSYGAKNPPVSGLFTNPTMSIGSLDSRICPEGSNLSNKGWFDIIKKPINMSWHISKITTSKNNIINYYYEDEYYNILSNISTEYQEDMQATLSAYSINAREDVFTSKKLIKIETPSEYLVINYETNNREDVRKNENPNSLKAYKDLQFFNKSNYQFKRIDFITNYKISPGIELAATNLKYLFKRLFLDKIIINKNEIYQFEYNLGSLPHRHSFEQDYWGYYNANNAEKENKTLLPDLWYYPENIRSNTRPGKFSIYKKNNFTGVENKLSTTTKYANNLSKYVADRNINEQTLKNGILEKIVYPTKGYEKFFYEPNDFLYEGDLKKGYGLRISSIEQHDSNDNLLSNVLYKYKSSNGSSSGMITNLPAFGHLYRTNMPNNDGVQSYVSSNSYSYDNNLYYSRVEKSNLGNGKIVTDFLIPFSMETEAALTYNGDFLYKKNFLISKFKLKSYNSFLAPLNTFEFPLNTLNNNCDNLFGKASKISVYNEDDQVVSITENFYNLSSKSTKHHSFSGATNSLAYDNYIISNIFAEFLLTKEEETLFYANNTKVFNVSEYAYNRNGLVTKVKKVNSKGKDVVKEFKYPNDFTYRSSTEVPVANIYSNMVDKNMINYAIETVSTINDKVVSSEIMDFQAKPAGTKSVIAPAFLKVFEPSSTASNYKFAKIDPLGLFVVDPNVNDKMIFDSYDSAGNLTMQHKPNGIYTTTLWGYNKRYPIAQFENATFSTIAAALGVQISQLENFNEENLNQINALRLLLTDVMIKTYTYLPLVGVSSTTDVKGISTFYEYDSFGRLMFVKDQDLNVLQRYCYGYQGQQVDCSLDEPYATVYKSIAQTGSFTKNSCPAGATGSTMTFNQPAGAATSTVSQNEADSKALALFNINGQANANTNGFCTFKSVALSGSFTRNNCGTAAGSAIAFSQAAGTATSTISQADADAKGLALFNTNGQANANTSGICTFNSPAESGTFTKGSCASSGGVGSSVVYTQQAGAVKSTISQADADKLGHEKFIENGRLHASVTGVCTYSSIAQEGRFIKNNCLQGEEGSIINYSQPAGAVTSTISQAVADEAGLAKFNADGQLNANQTGTCTQFITYTPRWNAATKTLALLAVASTSNHNGVTIRFNISYQNGGNNSQTAEIYIAAGKTSNAISIRLDAQSSPSVELIAIERIR